MKQLTCEMCGSTDLMKQDGVFVCQSCGCKYSVDEAKKMMVEGTVEVKGTVAIDISAELDNLYQLARRSLDLGDEKEAAEYYDRILEKDPNSWEALCCSVFCRRDEVFTRYVGRLENALRHYEITLKLIKENVTEKESIISAVNTVTDFALKKIGELAEDGFRHDVDDEVGFGDWRELIRLAYECGNLIESTFEEFEECREIAITAWKTSIDQYTNAKKIAETRTKVSTGKDYSFGVHLGNDIVTKTVKKVQKYESTYVGPELIKYVPSAERTSGGCYVATAVYGSYDCPQVWTLRRYRDDTLAETWYGRAFIHTYYAISPTLVKWLGHTEWFKKMWKGKLDRMVANLNAEGVEDTPYEDKVW